MDTLDTAIAAAKAFRTIDPNIGVQTIHVLLTIARQEGKLIVTDLERLCDISRTGASRNVSLLSSVKLKDGRYGYGLIEFRYSDLDRRVRYLALTKSGEQVVGKIRTAIEETRK